MVFTDKDGLATALCISFVLLLLVL